MKKKKPAEFKVTVYQVWSKFHEDGAKPKLWGTRGTWNNPHGADPTQQGAVQLEDYVRCTVFGREKSKRVLVYTEMVEIALREDFLAAKAKALKSS